MDYSTLDDLKEQLSEDELIGLTDDADAGVIDTSVTDRAISDANAVIDGYCKTKYTVPLEPVPDIIRKISVDLAIYNLFSRKGDVIPEMRIERYKNAIKFLEHISIGKITLGVDTPAPSTDGGPEATKKKTDRIFTMGDDEGGGSLDNY